MKALPTAFDPLVAPTGRPVRAQADASGSMLLFSWFGRRYLATVSRHSGGGEHRANEPAASVTPAGDDEFALTPPDVEHLKYGGPESFLLDMQGIDTFLYGRAKLFRDAAARAAALALGLVDPHLRYLRVGAAGAPSTPHHPGGEVLECSLLEGRTLGGRSTSSSGYLPPGEEHSVAAALTVAPGRELLDERSVYSHTAFLSERASVHDDSTLAVRIAPRDGPIDVLDAIQVYARRQLITAFAMRIFARVPDRVTPPSIVVGRVLRRLPTRRFQRVEQATTIASEQQFTLRAGQELHCFGTHYPRFEPDWSAFRGGKPYEPRGHVHMRLIGERMPDQHAISHLRELRVSPGTTCLALLTPVSRAVRIDPVVRRGNSLMSRSSGRVLIEVLSDIAWRTH